MVHLIVWSFVVRFICNERERCVGERIVWNENIIHNGNFYEKRNYQNENARIAKALHVLWDIREMLDRVGSNWVQMNWAARMESE